MSKNIFILKTKSNLTNSLKKELSKIIFPSFPNSQSNTPSKIEDYITIKHEDRSEIKVESDNKTILKIINNSRIIDNIQVQIGNSIQADSEKTLKIGLKSIPFEKYLPFENANKYKLPIINTEVHRSKLFHTKMISNIVGSYLNRSAFKHISTSQSLENKHNHNIKLLDLPSISIIISSNKLSAYSNLSVKSLSLHGYKEITKGDSLKENIASACVIQSGILSLLEEYRKESKNMTIWDPFCGCGTLIIEAYLYINDISPRNSYGFSYLLDYPYMKSSFEEYEKSEKVSSRSINTINNYNYNIVGSDMSSYAIKASITNTKKANFHKSSSKPKENIEEVSFDFAPFLFHEKINEKLDFFLGDFEKIFSLVNKTPHKKNVFLLSHLPYLVDGSTEKTYQLYKSFGKFLRKNYDEFESVCLLIKKETKKII